MLTWACAACAASGIVSKGLERCCVFCCGVWRWLFVVVPVVAVGGPTRDRRLAAGGRGPLPQACIRCPVNHVALAVSGESQHNSHLACVAVAQKVSSSRSCCFVFFSLSIFLSPLQQSLFVLGLASRHLLSSSSSSLSLFTQLLPAVELSAATHHRIIWTFTIHERPALICFRSSIPA